MAKRDLQALALHMRAQGMSYSQIKCAVDVSKSTLSVWLSAHPLSEERIRELRDRSAIRIERYRDTRRKQRERRWNEVLDRVANDVGILSDREVFIAGCFLYWGEGSKTTNGTTAISNTDPAMILFFISWLQLLGVSRDKLRVRIHLYSDMNVDEELRYWSEALDIPRDAFRKPYIKLSQRSALTYPQKFTHGTCNLLYENRDIYEYVLMSLKYLRSQVAAKMEL